MRASGQATSCSKRVPSIEVELALQLIESRRRIHGADVVAIDCGANIGIHTIEWATAITEWGSVIAIEAQERIYYALAGNIAINNGFNAIAMHAAVSSEPGIMQIPTPDYFLPSSFGNLELKPRVDTEFHRPADRLFTRKDCHNPEDSIDALALPRVDMIKLDIQGMELEALEGAQHKIGRSHPIILVESIKAGRSACVLFSTNAATRSSTPVSTSRQSIKPIGIADIGTARAVVRRLTVLTLLPNAPRSEPGHSRRRPMPP